MKCSYKLFLVAVLLVLSSCTSISYPSSYGVGNRSANGQAEGEWTIYRNIKHAALIKLYDDHFVYAKGRYSNGQPEGQWTVWNEEGVKMAELLFSNGMLNGDARIFNFSTHYPTAVDKPIIAHFENCKLKYVNGYKDNQLVFKTVMSENSNTINDCNRFYRFKTEPEPESGYTHGYSGVVDGIARSFFDYNGDGYAAVIKNAPLYSKP